MTTVASKELKNRLGRYLRMVRSGEPVQITDHGRLIGCIVPLEDAAASSELAKISRLVSNGELTLGKGNLRRSHKPAKIKPGRSTTEMIIEDRR